MERNRMQGVLLNRRLSCVPSYASFVIDCRRLLSAACAIKRRIMIQGELVQTEAYDRGIRFFLHVILRLPAIFWPMIWLTVLGCAVVIFGAKTRRQSLSEAIALGFGRTTSQCLAAVALLIVEQPGHASAQRPTIEQIQEMLSGKPQVIPDPGPDYKLPYYRWPDGAAIKVMLVTDGQRGRCVEVVRDRIQEKIQLIRRDIPALRNMADITVVDTPKEPQEFAILLGLPTERDSIKDALSKYALASRPHAKPIVIDESIGSAYGFRGGDDPGDRPIYEIDNQVRLGIERNQIVSALRWTVHQHGLRFYSESKCRSLQWAGPLVSLLGAKHFSPYYAVGWPSTIDEAQKLEWRELADRLFLQALYGCAGPVVDQKCIVALLVDLWRTSPVPKE